MTGDQERMLEFERAWQNSSPASSAKEQAIAYEFGMSVTAYYQQLNALLDTAAAVEHDPPTVLRLRRVRSSRVRSRSLR